MRAAREILDAVTPLAAAAQESTSAEWVATLRSSNLGRLLQPVDYGGRGVSADQFVADVYEVAALDGSLGWLTAVFNAAAHDVAALPETAAGQVWKSGPDALVAASYRAEGRVGHDGRLTGRWESVVGARYADWLLVTADHEDSRCRLLLPRQAARIDPVGAPAGLAAAGICDVTISELSMDDRQIFENPCGRPGVLTAAGATAAVVGSADGIWRAHVDQVRGRLATSVGGHEVTDDASAQVARAASDIDAAHLQVASSIQLQDDARAAVWAHRQAVARARDAADRLLSSSRHALDASDPVTRQWQDVHAGCRMAVRLLDDLEPVDPA